MKITVELDHTDFGALRSNSMQWHGLDWKNQSDRFTPVIGTTVEWGFAWAYWLDDATSMILARSYLDALGRPYQVLYDDTEASSYYVIVTDYSISEEQERAWDEEPNREPTAEQERAWDEREDAARGRVE